MHSKQKTNRKKDFSMSAEKQDLPSLNHGRRHWYCPRCHEKFPSVSTLHLHLDECEQWICSAEECKHAKAFASHTEFETHLIASHRIANHTYNKTSFIKSGQKLDTFAASDQYKRLHT